MCYNCDCGDPKDTMGNDDNITDQITFAGLATKWGVTFDQVRQIVYNDLIGQPPTNPTQVADIAYMYDLAAKAWGQTIDEGRMYTLKLLKREMNIQ
jgi:hypothetical protein